MSTVFLSLPLWVISALVILVFVGVAAAGLLAARRWILPRMDIQREDAEFGGAMVQAILVFYALAIALVAVSTWEEHSAQEDRSSQEAATIASMYRQAQLYPPAVRDELDRGLVDYLTYIINDAWPAQARGEVPDGGTDLLTSLQSTLGNYEPTTNGMQAVHEQMLATFREMVELRRLRLDAVGGQLSGAMWAFVLIGALLSVFSAYLFVVSDRRLHLLLVSLLATIIAMVVILIAAYDSPFVGDLGVKSDSYQLILDSRRAVTPS